MSVPKPVRKDVEEMAELLCRIDATSSHELRYFTAKQTDWRMAHAIVKRCVERLINDSTRRLRRDVREQLLLYAVKYGLQTHGAKADEIMSEVFRFRLTPTMKDDLVAAAKRAGIEDASDWARSVLMAEASKVQGKGKAR